MINKFSGKRVFISGGAGVIGKELVQLLLEQGATLFVGDLKARPKEFPEEILYRQGDLNDVTKEELLEFEPEYYFHLAATFERSTETYEFWQENYQHNIQLSHHLIDCLKETPSLKKVIFASSYLIYNPELYLFDKPQKNALLLSENSAVFPRNLCGGAKLMHELELSFIQSFSQYNLKAVSARIFRSYGRGSQDIISRWVRLLLNNQPIEVFCKEGMFDYIFAADVALGLMHLAASSESGVVNLGRGEARSVEAVVNVLQKEFPKMQVQESVAKDMLYEASEADMSRFKKVTGWQPATRLEDAIPLIIEHERNHSQ